MSSIFNYFSYLPKQVMIVFGLVFAVSASAVTMASWSPERPTYTVDNPAPHVTFNSITDNPNYGDERTFFDVKDNAISTEGGFADTMTVENGQELLLRTYVHNNASPSLNESGDGVAQNASVRVLVPEGTFKDLRTISYISADNATPGTVSDTVDLNADQPFSLEYVAGSAIAYTNAVPSGYALSDSIVVSGAPVGYEGADGTIPGCFEYTAIVTVVVKVQMTDYEVEKRVRLDGQDKDSWTDELTAEPGDTVEYRIDFRNTGDKQVDDVAIGDQLPANQTYVPGSTVLYNTNHRDGLAISSDNIVSGGIVIGDYLPKGNAAVSFKAVVDEIDELECGLTRMVNRAVAVSGDFKAVEDTATVKTSKVCEQEEEFLKCTSLTASLDTQSRKASVTAKIEKSDNVEVVGYEFNWGDGATSASDKNTASHTYNKDGNYKIVAKVGYKESGENKTTQTATCKANVKFETPKDPEKENVCRDGKVITILKTERKSTDKTGACVTELPNTGAGSVLTALFGTGSLAAAVRGWVASRKGLASSLLG